MPAPEPGKPAANEGLPADPISELTAMASQLHELYGAYLQAGFTDAQALYLVSQVASGGRGTPPA
jgi:hypothetical protein